MPDNDPKSKSPAGAPQGQSSSGSTQVQDDNESSSVEFERLQNDLNEARDRLLRAQAEFENFRKRSRRELDDERKYANAALLQDLLPVADNMDRAIEAAQKTQKSSDAVALLEGFQMVRQQLDAAMARHHCQPIKALGEPFDPHLHAAITAQPSSEHPANTVLAVVQTGYQLHDRVIRPSQVVVSTRADQ